MSENVTKSEVLAEKMAIRKEIIKDLKEMRADNNHDGADFAMTELKRLNRLIKNLSRWRKVLTFYNNYVKIYL